MNYQLPHSITSASVAQCCAQSLNSPGGLTPDTLLLNHVGCTPLVDAIKADEFCQKQRENLVAAMKKERDDTMLPQSIPSPSSKGSGIPELLSSGVPSKITIATPKLHSPHQALTLKTIPRGEGLTPDKEPSSHQNSSCNKTRESLTGNNGTESLDARKQKQAQRKEEWQRKHKLKTQEKELVSGEQDRHYVITTDGGAQLVTDGMCFDCHLFYHF